ncbi:MAG: MFS transporter [Ilumatobacteraceae bacterium]
MTVSASTRTVVRVWPLDPDPSSDLLAPRHDLIVEERLDADEPDVAHFRQLEGPFTEWRRTVRWTSDGWSERTDYRLAIPWFGWLFALPVRFFVARRGHEPGRPGSDPGVPWWAPRDRLDARTAAILGLLAAAAMSSAFVNTLFTQTVTFAADDFGVGDTAIGIAGSIVRVGILITIPLAVLADRVGRRSVVVTVAWAAPIVTALGAIAPNFPLLVATQAVGRPLGLALDFLIAVIAAEEMPRNTRAYAVGILAMASGLGAGIAVAALPLTDLGESSWRFVYLITLIWLVVAIDITRRLPETRRFIAPHREHVAIDRRRFALLAGIAVGVNLFVAPASFFQNRYLDEIRGLSGSGIAVFTLATATPAALGLVLGGQLADRQGRRRVIAVALPVAATLITVSFSVGGSIMWISAFAGGLAGGVAYPALAVYRSELFPTGNRGRAAGLLTVAALLGGVIGLLATGSLLDAGWSHAAVMAMLAPGQLVAVALVLGGLPETAHRELEDLNPR